MKRELRHKIHKYKRVNIATKPKEYFVFRCVLSNCSHYITELLIIGKNSLCWNCNNPFVISRHKAKPVCDSCRIDTNEEDEKVVEILKGIGVI